MLLCFLSCLWTRSPWLNSSLEASASDSLKASEWNVKKPFWLLILPNLAMVTLQAIPLVAASFVSLLESSPDRFSPFGVTLNWRMPLGKRQGLGESSWSAWNGNSLMGEFLVSAVKGPHFGNFVFHWKRNKIINYVKTERGARRWKGKLGKNITILKEAKERRRRRIWQEARQDLSDCTIIQN